MKRLAVLFSLIAVFTMVPALSGAVCANTTNCTFDLNSTQVAAFGTGPFGTVNLTLSGATINFIVDLADGFGFNLIDTGTHEAFAFNNTFSPATVTMSAFSSSLYSQTPGAPGTNPPFGVFENAVQSTCTNGGGCGVNMLTFTVSRIGGFTDVNQLVELSTGGGTAAYFAADIANAAGATGAVGAVGPGYTTVPEPKSYLSLLGAFGVLAFVYERRRRSINAGVR